LPLGKPVVDEATELQANAANAIEAYGGDLIAPIVANSKLERGLAIP
jgi:hypothetical protein